MTDLHTSLPKYVIINDIDKPEFAMICQWVLGIGYCYLDRSGTKPDHDAMRGRDATPVETFGIAWADNCDGTVSFYLTDRPSEATYRDGIPRRWQERPGVDARTFPQLTTRAVQRS